MTWIQHLEELRRRLIRSLMVLILTCAVSSILLERLLFNWLTSPLPPGQSLQFLGLTEAFMIHFKIALLGGVLLAVPYLMFEVWGFIRPALRLDEKRFLLPFLLLTIGAFGAGVLFCHRIVLPLMLKFFLSFSTEKVQYGGQLSLYMNTVITLLLSFGCVFEAPALVVLLARFGILSPELLSKNRGYLVVGIFIIAAVLTPPDVVSQILLAVPLLILMEISILLSRLARRKERESKEEESEGA